MVSRFRLLEVRVFWFKVSGSGFCGSGFSRLGVSGSYFRCLGFTHRGFEFGVSLSGFSAFRVRGSGVRGSEFSQFGVSRLWVSGSGLSGFHDSGFRCSEFRVRGFSGFRVGFSGFLVRG